MPLIENAVLHNPLALQAICSWTYVGQMNGLPAGKAIRAPIYSNRGSFHLGADYKLHLLAGRVQSANGVRLASSKADTYTDFSATDTTSFFYVYGYNNIDSILWVMTGNNLAQPGLFALSSGTDIPASGTGAYTDRSATFPFTGHSGNMMLEKALDEGALYVAWCSEDDNLCGISRAASSQVAISSGFTEITPSTRFAGIILQGYGVSNDGQTHMVSTTTQTLRSVNGGVNWTPMTFSSPILKHCEFMHVPRHGAASWVMSCDSPFAAGRGVWWSNNNGSTWARSTIVDGGSPTDFYLSDIQKLDSTGTILVGFVGIAPLKIYISLNGGRKWAFLTSLIPPYYDMDANPLALDDPPGPPIIVNDNNRIIVMWPGETGDEGVFVSGTFGTFGRIQNTPSIWL